MVHIMFKELPFANNYVANLDHALADFKNCILFIVVPESFYNIERYNDSLIDESTVVLETHALFVYD